MASWYTVKSKKISVAIMAYPQIIVKMKDLFLKISGFLNKRSFYGLYVFFFFVIYFLITYMTLDRVYSLDDHFFHIRFAELLREKGISALTDFQSIYFSRMGMGHEYLVYYNFLFYLTLIPFTFFKPLLLGIKIYGILALSFSFTTVYIFLKKFSVKNSFLWTLLFLVALLQSNWLLRFTLARPFTLAPAFLVIMLYFTHRKKYLIMAIISFLYFYWHTATFIFPFCLALGYFLFEQFYGKRPDWKIIIWPLFGTTAAVFLAYLISPGIIAYLKDVIFPVFFDTSMAKTTGIMEGSEVYGRDLFMIVNSFFSFFALLCFAGTYEVTRYIKEKQGKLRAEDTIDSLTKPLKTMLFMASLVFFLAAVLSIRFLDYFVFFCFLYVALATSDLMKFFKIDGELFKKSFKISAVVIVCYFLTMLSLNFHDSLGGSNSHLIARAPAEWLNSNLKQDEIIFNVNWDAFPTLYYFTGDKFRYVTGLEPRFLYDLNHKMYWKWFNIGKGIYCESDNCSEIIKQRDQALAQEKNKKNWYAEQGNLIADAVLTDFKTDIIVTSIGTKDLLAVMDNSSRFKKEFFDDKNSAYAIYRITKNNF